MTLRAKELATQSITVCCCILLLLPPYLHTFLFFHVSVSKVGGQPLKINSATFKKIWKEGLGENKHLKSAN